MAPRYTESIDSQIAQTLQLRGRIDTDGIPGVSEQDAAEFLAQYLRTHSEEPGLGFDGRSLVLRPVVADEPSAAGSPTQVPSAPQMPAGRSALRPLIIAVVILVLVALCVPVGCVVIGGLGASEANSSWPTSTSGRSTFYYFGTDS